MWNKLKAIHIVLILGILSCTKETIEWDRENNLETDTVTFLYQTNYVSHIDTQVTVQIDLVTFNDLESDKFYLDKSFNNTVHESNQSHITLEVSNVTTFTNAQSAYSTVLLFDKREPHWYSSNNIGFYLRRFYENIDESTSKVGVAYFSENENKSLSFLTENNKQYLDNSWEFNTEKTYEIINSPDNFQDGNYSNGTLEFVLIQLDNTIDSLMSTSNKVGDLSITLLSQGHYQSDQALGEQIDLLISKAKLNQIKVNLIGFNYDHHSPLRRLSIETSGFIGSTKVGFENYNQGGDQTTDKVTEIGALFQNLNFILSSNLSTHRCQFSVNIIPNTPQYATFSSGEMVNFGLNYDGGYYNIQFKIP